MTTPRRDSTQEPWAAWIQRNRRLDSVADGISCTNSDLWVHRYCTKIDRVGTRELQHLMLIEVKTFGSRVPDAQADTYQLIDQVFRRNDRRPYTRSNGQRRWVRLWGVHYVVMSASTPADSDWMTWDGREIDAVTFEELLRFERNPNTLRPRSDRRHHTASMAARTQAKLNLEESTAR